MKLQYKIEDADIVKDFLRKNGISRNLGKKIKLYGNIYINGELSYNYSQMKKNDILDIEYQEPNNPEIPNLDFPINILYEDEYLLIINKPANLTIQPSRKHINDNLIGRIKSYYLKQGITTNVHIVSRLDYATSGLLIVAKNGYVHHRLSEIEIKKKYIARVEGIFTNKKGIIDLPISKAGDFTIKRKVSALGQRAITEYQVLRETKDESMLELTLLTGRCHQIRVHLSTLNHPILGDKLYGNALNELLFLHSYYLEFEHPLLNKTIKVENYPTWYKFIG